MPRSTSSLPKSCPAFAAALTEGHVMAITFNVVLFDWRGTLFYDESDADWICAAAASIGRTLSDAEATVLAGALSNASEHPDVLVAR